jgi:hypothetical protein
MLVSHIITTTKKISYTLSTLKSLVSFYCIGHILVPISKKKCTNEDGFGQPLFFDKNLASFFELFF